MRHHPVHIVYSECYTTTTSSVCVCAWVSECVRVLAREFWRRRCPNERIQSRFEVIRLFSAETLNCMCALARVYWYLCVYVSCVFFFPNDLSRTICYVLFYFFFFIYYLYTYSASQSAPISTRKKQIVLLGDDSRPFSWGVEGELISF